MASQAHPQRPAAVAAFVGPALLLAGILWHPLIVDLRDNAAVVHHMASDTGRWLGSHLLVALGAAATFLAFLAARYHIRSSVGAEPWTARALVPLTLGSFLFTMLPAMEIAMLAVDKAGGDLLATHNALDTWFMPILLAGSALFGVGSILFGVGVRKSAVLPPVGSWLVVGGLTVSALSRFVPMTASLMIGIGALTVALWTLGVSMWRVRGTARPAPA